jgi:NADPH:quinone reductase-like Zn-dependent oxidoreductase
VTETAPDVTDLAVGQRVAGLVPEAFGPVGVTDRRLLVPIPDGVTDAQAATMPVAHTTAYRALAGLARLSPGEKVLIHAATGAVGTAALQVARYLGAEVYATAHPDKWPVLLAAGIPQDRIASSRTAAFAEAFPPVDVVLNSLAGPLLDASFGLLRPGGRLVELGKTDHRDPATVRQDIEYSILDLSAPDPETTGAALAVVAELTAAGHLAPLPLRTFPMARAVQALRHMQQARHTGKIVLTLPEPAGPAGSTLITGGTGAVAGLLAEHLLASGTTRRLVLASRSGPDSARARELLRRLTDGRPEAEVTVVACDTSDPAQVEALAATLAAHRVTTVVHTAAALQDATIVNLTADRMRAVMLPKVAGAVLLHAALPEAHHVYLSSAAATLGSPGQGNYAAANTFLDAFATHRHTGDRAATSIAYGLWHLSEGLIGHLGDADLARLARGGVTPLTAEDGAALFDAAVASGRGAVVAGHFSTARLRDQAEAGTLHPLWRGLVRAGARRAAGAAATGDALVRKLAAASSADRARILLDLVRGQAAVVLGHASGAAVEVDRGFLDLGFDSLSAVEFRNRLGAAANLRLPATLIFDYPNVAALARHLQEELAPGGAEEGAPGAAGADAGDEAEIRRILAAVPIARLRDAGLVEALLRLGGEGGTPGVADPSGTPEPGGPRASAAEIEDMDVDALLQLALHDAD